MKSPLSRFLCMFGLSVLGVFILPALSGTITTTTFTWTGEGSYGNPFAPENWQDNLAPSTDPIPLESDIEDQILLFGDVRHDSLSYVDLYAHQLLFVGNPQGYFFMSNNGLTHLGSGGIVYLPDGEAYSTIYGEVQLHASQVWEIGSGGLVVQGGDISDLLSDNATHGYYQIEKTGDGVLVLLGHANSNGDAWAGGLKITDGLVLGSATTDHTSLGSGIITFNGGALGFYEGIYHDQPGYLTNNIVSKGEINLNIQDDLTLANNNGSENFIQLDADTTLRVDGRNLTIEKDITDNGAERALTVDSHAVITHLGGSDWSGGTNVDQGLLLFMGQNNLPAGTSNITIGDDGYVGIGADNTVGDFLSKVNLAASTGTIGFDSDPYDDQIPDAFTSPIDLTGANTSLRIGSATEAILGDMLNMTATAQITPAGGNYRFGNGGGSLFVASQLTDGAEARGLEVESPSELPLTLWLLNPNNDFTGDVFVDHSALIYGAGTLPSPGANITLTSSGYVGTAKINYSTAWLNTFDPDTAGIIGFDVFPGDETPVAQTIANLDTSRFTNDAAIGTATWVEVENSDDKLPALILTGTITPNVDDVHRFAAYKGGVMEVSGTLTGNRLILGRPDSMATFGDSLTNELSTVIISGDNANALAMGTTFYGGRLIVGQSNGTVGINPTSSLGPGTLTVNAPYDEGGNDDATPQLAVTEAGIVIPNAIFNPVGTLDVGGKYNFELSGSISGYGELQIGETAASGFELTLSGDNTFSGGTYISNGAIVHVTSDAGLGLGPLGFFHNGGTAILTSTAPMVSGLAYGDGGFAAIQLTNNQPTTLTINQAYRDTFTGTISGTSAQILKTGSEMLWLSGSGIIVDGLPDGAGHNVGIEINQGALVFAGGTDLRDNTNNHTPAIKINSGGTFAISDSSNLYNPVIINNGGRLAGQGFYDSNVSIGNGAILSPGLGAAYHSIGTLQFSHLELNGGGILELDIAPSSNLSNSFVHDLVKVSDGPDGETLVLNATSANPFTIKVTSYAHAGALDVGTLEGFLAGQTYSWLIIDASETSIDFNGIIAGLGVIGDFDPASFALDTSSFSAALPGSFSVSLDAEQGVFLNFTPVPEPSTYALMALGLGVVAWSLRRRRKS